jgi:hypothetical protein
MHQEKKFKLGAFSQQKKTFKEIKVEFNSEIKKLFQ